MTITRVRHSPAASAWLPVALALALAGCSPAGGGGGGGGGRGPAISTQPQSVTVGAGQSATFTVVAAGAAPLVYEWKKGSAGVGTDSATLTLTNVQASDAGSYTVTVSNAAGAVTSSPATLTVSGSGPPLSGGEWVVGSHPDYHWGGLPADRVPYEHLTHLFLSFLEPTGSNGSYGMTVTGYGPGTLAEWKTEAQKFITRAHAAGVKVVVDIGGENGGVGVFQEGTGTEAKAAALAKAIVATCKDIGVDGVDLDWEPLDKVGAPRLLRYLRQEWPDGIVTVAVGPSYGDEQVELAKSLAAVADAVDAVMIMSYIAPNQTWTWWVVPVPLTPLHGAKAPWDGLPQPYSLDREVEVWTKQAGVPASKLVIGVGGFGLAWGDTNSDGIAPVAPYANYGALEASGCGVSQFTCNDAADTERAPLGCTDNHVTQQWVDKVVAEAGGRLTLQQDAVGGVDYWAAPARNQPVSVTSPCDSRAKSAVSLIFYETPRSMGAKVDFVRANGLRGMEFWTLGQLQNASGAFPNLEAVKP